MMGKGADGGCRENRCNVSLDSFFGPTQFNGLGRIAGRNGPGRRSVDGFSQVLKALALRPMCTSEDASAVSNGSLVATNSGENRRRNRVKKMDAIGGLQKDHIESSWNRDTSGGQFWQQVDEFFRDLTPEDIQLLYPATKLSTRQTQDALDPLLQLPPVACFYKDTRKEEEQPDALPVEEHPSIPPVMTLPEDERDVKENVAKEVARSPEGSRRELLVVGLKRKFPAANVANKKRKFTVPAAEISTTVISPPVNDDDDELCDVCYSGDSNEQNQILFCDSCNVAVHQECYGIKVVPDGQWLCAWCTHSSARAKDSARNQLPGCVMCPRRGGALKCVTTNKNANKIPPKPAFGHLFCAQWIPETYIGDVSKMEPIMNVDGVREERWKLLCSICKEKYGACIQCSHGMCATAFHPLCARQAKLRMEVSCWEGSEEVDLRAFCSKHTLQLGKPLASLHEGIQVEQEESKAHSHLTSETTPFSKVGKICTSDSAEENYGGTVGDRRMEVKVDQSANVQDTEFSSLQLENDKAVAAETCSPQSRLGLENAIGTIADDRCTVRKVMGWACSTTSDVAVQMGISESSLCSWLEGKELNDQEVHSKIKLWVSASCSPLVKDMHGTDAAKKIPFLEQKDSAKLNTSLKTYRNKRRKLEQPSVSVCKGQPDIADIPLDLSCASQRGEDLKEMQTFTRLPEGREQKSVEELNLWNVLVATEEVCEQGGQLQSKTTTNISASNMPEHCQMSPLDHQQDAQLQGGNKEPLTMTDGCSVYRAEDEFTGLNVHPCILERLRLVESNTAQRCCQMEKAGEWRLQETRTLSDGLWASASAHDEVKQSPRSKWVQRDGSIYKLHLTSKIASGSPVGSIEAQIKQLEHARKSGVLDMAPQDEIEEEIISLQLMLIACAEKNCCLSEQLITKVITSLADDLHSSQRRAKDLLLVNQYLNTVREAKKQGRKERRNKEAQAVSAAAAAAAAASPRIGTLRRDAPGGHLREPALRECANEVGTTLPENLHLCGVSTIAPLDMPKPMKLNTSAGRTSSTSRISSHDKGNLLGQEGRVSTLKNHGNHAESRTDLSACDICKGPSRPNPVIICSRCKIVVHQECYGLNRSPVGDWYCQPCVEIVRQSQGLRAPAVDPGTPGCGVACALCFGSSGAFKRYCQNNWAHVFCAQWIPEDILKKEETGLIEGLKLVPMDKVTQECGICHRAHGARLRCSFGHCHGSFHPLCAREAGFFMSVKCISGGRLQYRAYCEKHSPQQRQKAEARRCGSTDELSALVQMRAELERVRIICERICRRERLKRDRMVCIKNTYLAHLLSLPSSVMASNDLSGTSNSMDTPDTYKEDSWAADNRHDELVSRPQGMESESVSWTSAGGEVNKYQDSLSGESVYQTQLSCSEASRQTSARSQTSEIAAVHEPWRGGWIGSSMKDNDQKRPRRQRKAEPLQTEVIMTPIEASVQNQRLPKGYAYVPVGLVSSGRVNPSEASISKDL